MSLSTLLLCASIASAQARRNVLMIAIDDMRPEINAYGFGHMKTPNIDALAASGTVFTRAYVQVAVCMPSRQAILTSRRPDTSMGWTISPNQHFRNCGGQCGANKCSELGGSCGIQDLVTLPGWFKKNGYTTVGAGKIFHEGPDTIWQDFNYSWTPAYTPGLPTGIWDVSPPSMIPKEHANDAIWVYNDSVSESTLLDGLLAEHCSGVIANLSQAQRAAEARGDDKTPFFLGCGFHRPHIPWRVPQKYFDMYPLDEVELAPNVYTPTNVPKIALQDMWGSWSHCSLIPPNGALGKPKTGYPFLDLCKMVVEANWTHEDTYPYDNSTVPAWISKKARQAYWAALSYTDAQIGKVLKALKDNNVEDDTVVVMWGDHGYQLGDNDQWAKHTNFEHATRIPLIARVPGQVGGQPSDALVESVDVYPFLVEAATGIQLAHCPESQTDSRNTGECTEGFSLLPLIPMQEDQAQAEWNRSASHSQFTRPCGGKGGADCPNDGNKYGVMGYTQRMNDWRYTEWVLFNYSNANPQPIWDQVFGRELYDHRAAPVPDSFNMEHINVVNDPANKDLVDQMHERLVKCGARPDLCT